MGFTAAAIGAVAAVGASVAMKPKAPKATPAPDAPDLNSAANAADAAKKAQSDEAGRLRGSQGRSSTILTSPLGVGGGAEDEKSKSRKTLLGA